MKTIGSGAFRFCWRVKTMQLPATVTSIGKDAFYACDRLTLSVTKNSYAHTWCKNNGVRYAVK